MNKLRETASSDQISAGKDLRAQLSEGEHGSLLSTGADACIKVSVAMLSPPQRYMTSGQEWIWSKLQYDFKGV